MSDWKFDLDEVGPDGVVEREADEPPIEPGRPAAENVVFLVLGMAVALFVLAKLAGVA